MKKCKRCNGRGFITYIPSGGRTKVNAGCPMCCSICGRPIGIKSETLCDECYSEGKKEKIKIPEESDEFHFDFTSQSTFELEGETYEFVEDYPSRKSDGEDHNYVFKRKSDDKLFKYFWWYHHSSGDDIFENREMIEV